MSKFDDWIKKPDFFGAWAYHSCAYCFFDCSPEKCDSVDYMCDCFEPNVAL